MTSSFKRRALKRHSGRMALCAGIALAAAGFSQVATAADDGLLFRLSADKNLTADVAKGDPVPNFSDKASVVPTGVSGGALSTGDDNVLSWNAPGNIYAQRGTVSFFWRSRTPVGRAPFVLYRVGYADHSSWDMVWLRIDWNGHGYDAFVTDNNLARVRVSFKLDELPKPDAWTHLAFSWDETTGVKLYVNGKQVAQKAQVATLDSGLDQFGMAARAVSPHQVMSRYNFMRGSDYDELRIYDHALADDQIAALSRNESPSVPAQAPGDFANAATVAEWNLRYGWNRAGDVPVALTAPVTTIRKVEFTDAKDIKEFMYKATDGIAETTWPGVYNRSRLAGRNDYFTLPDWNVYVDGGKALTLTLPDEAFNHVEIEGAAYGKLTYAKGDTKAETLATRAQGQERTFNQFDSRQGGTLTFTNVAQETPIQEIGAYNIVAGSVPNGTFTQTYTINANAAADSPNLKDLNGFIAGRYTPDSRSTVVALPDAAPFRPKAKDDSAKLPLVHILIPYEYGASPANLPLYRSWNYGWENMHDGLDGIAIDIPALNVKPTAGGLFPLNIQVKDPIWPDRDMLDVTVAIKPGEARTVWLDLRDRILPNKSFYLTIAGAGQDFNAASLNGAKVRLVFKDRQEALKEHVADRFNQVKDNWGFLVEEHTASKRERLYQRLVADMTDLLRVDPDNLVARQYWADIMYNNQSPLPYTAPATPAGVPTWAYRQLEALKGVRHFVNWWIDNRQADYGDFGGGISDDTDLMGQWPGLALMGVDPEKIRVSQMRLADAAYKNGMFTNGLSTIMTDELHAYEEGINSNGEALYINYGDPKVVERLMTTVDAYQRVISVNDKGHMHFNTNWYSGADSYREGPFEWGKYYSYLVLHPGVLMAEYNGDATGKKYVIGLADGILAHGKQNADGTWTFADEINWRTDETRGVLGSNQPPHQLLWAAYRWTGDTKYLNPFGKTASAMQTINENTLDILNKRDSWGTASVKKVSGGAKATEGDMVHGGYVPPSDNLDLYLAWQTTGDTKWLESLYGNELRKQDQIMYTQTEGHWWSDRVEIDSRFLQRTRMGGIAEERNQLYPGATVSWKFADDEDAVKVALLVPGATPNHFKVIAYNISDHDVKATMTGWDIASGSWEMKSATNDGDNQALPADAKSATVDLERSASLPVSFAPGKTTVYEFTLKTPGEPTQTRPDIGIGPDDIKIKGGTATVTVHSLGAKDVPAGKAELVDASGKVVAQVATPVLAAPTDLKPHTATVKLKVPAKFNNKGATVRLDLGGLKEVTQMNNSVPLN
jgi:hypothetical protein